MMEKKPVRVQAKYNQAQLEEASAIYKCPKLTNHMKAVNEASLELAKNHVSLLQNKGELFNLAKKSVHDKGYQYVKNTSIGACSSANAEKKRKYLSNKIHEERMEVLSESIKSLDETIKLLFKFSVKSTMRCSLLKLI